VPASPTFGRRAKLAAGDRRAACEILIAVRQLPVERGFELRALQKLNAAEIGLGQVGAIDYGLEKISALEASAHQAGAAKIGTA